MSERLAVFFDPCIFDHDTGRGFFEASPSPYLPIIENHPENADRVRNMLAVLQQGPIADALDWHRGEAALREIKEETNLDVDITSLIDVVDSLTHDDDGKVRFHYTLVDFTAEWRDGTAVAGSDAAGVRWVCADDLDRYELWTETIRIIEMSAAQR